MWFGLLLFTQPRRVRRLSGPLEVFSLSLLLSVIAGSSSTFVYFEGRMGFGRDKDDSEGVFQEPEYTVGNVFSSAYSSLFLQFT